MLQMVNRVGTGSEATVREFVRTLAAITGVLGMIGGIVWYAAKLDNRISTLEDRGGYIAKLDARISTLEERVQVLTATGKTAPADPRAQQCAVLARQLAAGVQQNWIPAGILSEKALGDVDPLWPAWAVVGHCRTKLKPRQHANDKGSVRLEDVINSTSIGCEREARSTQSSAGSVAAAQTC